TGEVLRGRTGRGVLSGPVRVRGAGEQVSGDGVFGACDAKIGKIDGQERYAYHGFGVLALRTRK
uniref:hypothetical protein n=1 Tax=Streptomyces sp. I8-5 TaxID=3104277 RepID=UPI00386CB2EE